MPFVSECALPCADTSMLATSTLTDSKYIWGVILPNEKNSYHPDRKETGPTRTELITLLDEKLGRECSHAFAVVSIKSTLLLNDGLFYVLNSDGQLVGSATVEDGTFPWDPIKWIDDLYTLATTDVFSGAAAGSPVERYRKAKARGLTFSLNHMCTAGADPGQLLQDYGPDARDMNRPRGAGKAIIRGIRSFVETVYVRPMAQHLRWAPDFIRAWCFLEADVVDTALWFWEKQLAFKMETGIALIDEGVHPMYRPMFSNEGADHVPLTGPYWADLFITSR